MSIFEQIEIEDKVMKLCRSLHERLCGDSEDLDESIMTPDEVNQLEPFEALNHMTEAIKELLSHQRNLKIFEEYSSFHESDLVQSALQKLEADVREHIKIENQIKLYCENLECCIEEKEINNKKLSHSIKKKIGDLEKENLELNKQLKSLENELNSLKNTKKTENNEIDTAREPEAEIQAENEQKNMILLEKSLKVKKLKELSKSKEILCKELARENKDMMDLLKKAEDDKNKSGVDSLSFYKQKYKEVCREITVLNKKIKKHEQSKTKSPSPFPARMRKSTSPRSKKSSIKDFRKKSPGRAQAKSTKSLYKTMQQSLSRL